MVTSRAGRRASRRARAVEEFGGDADAALDVLELLELAWHDCVGDVSPPEDVVEDVWRVAAGDLGRLGSACRLAVTDRRDLRMSVPAAPAPGAAPAARRTTRVTRVEDGSTGLGDLAALFDRYRRHHGRPADEPATRAWLAAGLAAGTMHAVLAHDDATVAATPCGFATAVATPASLRLRHFWQLRDLFVDEQHRGRGVGRDLVLEVCRAARADGALRVALTTERDNAPAQRLYASLGFEPVRGHVALALDLSAGPGRA